MSKLCGLNKANFRLHYTQDEKQKIKYDKWVWLDFSSSIYLELRSDINCRSTYTSTKSEIV